MVSRDSPYASREKKVANLPAVTYAWIGAGREKVMAVGRSGSKHGNGGEVFSVRIWLGALIIKNCNFRAVKPPGLKRIVMEHVEHRRQAVLKFGSPFDIEVTGILITTGQPRRSATLGCWHVPYEHGMHNRLLTILKGKVWLGCRYSEETLAEALKASCHKAAINRPITLHWLRRNFTTHLLKGGTDLRLIKEILGIKAAKRQRFIPMYRQKVCKRIKSPFIDL